MLTTIKALVITAVPAAANFEVRLLQDEPSGAMVFEPTDTRVSVGDAVSFVPTRKGHNVEATRDMLPVAAESFKGQQVPACHAGPSSQRAALEDAAQDSFCGSKRL